MRRRGIRLVAALAGAAALAAACSSTPSALPPVAGAGWVSAAPAARPGAPVPKAPNVVFVLTDDLSWNLVRYMPHVMAMRRSGTTFSNYFVTDSLCCPSRTSLFTGEFPHDDGVTMNAGPKGGFNAFMANGDEHKTFATAVQARGYETGFFGKFLNLYQPLASVDGQRPYVPPGWSAWASPNLYGYEGYGYTMAVGRKLGTWGSAPSDYMTSVLSDKAQQFISTSARAHRPFFAEIATFAPHGPFVPAPADKTKFPGIQAPHGPAYGKAVEHAPPWLRKIPPLTKSDATAFNKAFRLRVQDVQSIDRMIGQLEGELRRLGVAGNTYLIFNSDNGLHLGEYDLRLGKRTAFDSDVRVPLVVTGPDVPAGRTVSQMTSNVDLAPTFDAIAGATAPDTVDGRSLLGLLSGRSPANWRSAVLVEHQGLDRQWRDPDYQPPLGGNPPSYEALRTSRYLYVEYVTGGREFYDLRTDPAELDNVYASLPAKLQRRLHAAAVRASRCSGTASCWAAQRDVP